MSMFPDRYDQPFLSLLTGAVLIALLALLATLTVNHVHKTLSLSSSSEGNTISVDGSGFIEAVPDIASLNVEVENRADTSEEAEEATNATMSELIKAFKLTGIENEDIQTQSVSVYEDERYDYESGEYTKHGWVASQTVDLTIRNTEMTEIIVGLATDGGATRTYGPNFRVDDTEDYLAQARDEAIADAKKKAGVIADSLDLKVGKIVDYYEYEGGGDYRYFEESYALDASGGGATYEEGSDEVSMNVTITFRLK